MWQFVQLVCKDIKKTKKVKLDALLNRDTFRSGKIFSLTNLLKIYISIFFFFHISCFTVWQHSQHSQSSRTQLLCGPMIWPFLSWPKWNWIHQELNGPLLNLVTSPTNKKMYKKLQKVHFNSRVCTLALRE